MVPNILRPRLAPIQSALHGTTRARRCRRDVRRPALRLGPPRRRLLSRPDAV